MTPTFTRASLAGTLALALALPVLAKQEVRVEIKTKVAKSETLNLACMQTAVEKRDNALITAVDNYHTALRAALVARRDALKAAWGMSDRTARRTAIHTAWRKFRSDRHMIRFELNKARRNAWQQFRTDRRACHVAPAATAAEAGGEAIDANL